MESHKKYFGFPPNVFFLSLVSFFNDIGGETIKKTIPLYLSNVLLVPTTIIGLIEGVADATPQLFQPVSGYLSDRSEKRRPWVVAGQVLRSSMVFLFWATSWPAILFIRFLDRSGKGVAQSPRDALIAGSADAGHIGRAFGLNRMFDNGGAVIGLLLASLILVFTQKGALLTTSAFQWIVLLAVVPLIANVIIVRFFVHDVSKKITNPKLSFRNKLGRKFYIFLFIVFIFTLGNSSDAFISLKAQSAGIPVWQIFLLIAGYSLVSSVTAIPLSSLSDRKGRKTLLVLGCVLYSVIYYLLGTTSYAATVGILMLSYGLYYGLTEGTARAYISDIVPSERRGTAYGLFNMVSGSTLLIASLLAGYLWQTVNPSATFYFGSVTAALAALGLILFI
jgi:MFS family permease